MKRLARRLALVAGAAVLAAVIRMLARRLTGAQEALVAERRAEPDPEALAARENGKSASVGFDLKRLTELKSDYKPLVEYLTYIQVKRSEGGESLLFVRDRDVDVMSAMLGTSRDEFVQQFQQLQVLLSMN